MKLKKYNFYTLVFFTTIWISCFEGRSQSYDIHNFPLDSTIWEMVYPDGAFESIFYYVMIGDTVLSGDTFQVVYKSDSSSWTGGTRQVFAYLLNDTASEKVYVRYPSSHGLGDSNHLLYDFSLEVGDTTIYYEKIYGVDSVLYLEVTSKIYRNYTTDPRIKLGTTLIILRQIGVIGSSFNNCRGQWLWTYTEAARTDDPFDLKFDSTWCDKSNLYNSCVFAHTPYGDSIISGHCSWDSSWVSTDEKETNNPFLVRQINQTIIVMSNDHERFSVSIIDLQGRKVYQNFTYSGEAINTSLWEHGVYIVLFENDGISHQAEKLMISR